MKPAYINWHGRTVMAPTKTRFAYLRAGAKGNGKVLAAVQYWPNSSRSVDQAYDIFQWTAIQEGYTIVGSSNDEE